MTDSSSQSTTDKDSNDALSLQVDAGKTIDSGSQGTRPTSSKTKADPEDVKPSLVTKRDFAVAAVSFLVSGAGGAYFQRWLSRARPSLKIVSLGFDGTAEPIKLTEDLRQKTDADSWGRSLSKFATFDSLRSRYRSTVELIRHHEAAIPAVDKWLASFKSRTQASSGPQQISPSEIDSNPYMQDELIGSSLIGNIRRLQVPDPPIADLSKFDYRLTVLDRSERAMTVQYGRKATRFPLDKMNSVEKRRMLTLMADSFAKGVLPNIVYYSEYFLSAARDDLLKLKALEETLREVLTREGRLTVQVALRNSGDSATVMRQFYAATLTSKQFVKSILMTANEVKPASSDMRGLLSRLTKEISDLEDEPGSDSNAEEANILPSAKGSESIGVAAGEIKTLTLQAVKPLGEEGKQIVRLFQSDIIECEVFGFTAEGTRISSAPVPFGKSAIEREQQDVLKNARG